MKITKKLLKDYAKNKAEIPRLEAELEEMRTTDSGLGRSVILDYSTGYGKPQSIVGFDRERYERRRKNLEEKKAMAAFVENWIEDIDDTITRTVFRMCYIKKKSWMQIAKELGYGYNVDYPRLSIRDKYLKSQGIEKE